MRKIVVAAMAAVLGFGGCTGIEPQIAMYAMGAAYGGYQCAKNPDTCPLHGDNISKPTDLNVTISFAPDGNISAGVEK